MKNAQIFPDRLRRDRDAFPNLCPGSMGVRVTGSQRPAVLARLLELKPKDKMVLQGYLTELVSRAIRQAGGEPAIYKTFAERVGDIQDTTLDAMPEHTKAALLKLAEMAKAAPLPCTEPGLVAHALANNGALCGWLVNAQAKEPEPAATPEATYRKLAMKHHPDKGGSGEAMAAISELWRSIKNGSA